MTPPSDRPTPHADRDIPAERPTPTDVARAVAVYAGVYNAARGEGDEAEHAMKVALTDYASRRAASVSASAVTDEMVERGAKAAWGETRALFESSTGDSSAVTWEDMPHEHRHPRLATARLILAAALTGGTQ